MNRNPNILLVAWLIVLLSLGTAACSKKEEKVATPSLSTDMTSTTGPEETGRLFDIERINRGAKLFLENCAQCHGPQAQGHPDWQRGRKEGFAAAPPLDGTGTDVGLSRKQMAGIIRNGISRKGVPFMPAWSGRVSDSDVDAIITWYQALWPAETYQQWRRANAGEVAPARPGKTRG